MCAFGDRLHVHPRSQHIRQVGDRDQLGLGSNRIDHLLRVKRPGLVHIDPFQNHALTLAQEMPRHNIGVVFHDAEDDLIPGLEVRHRPTVGHQIDAFRRACVHDDFVFAGSVQELCHDPTDGFVLLCRHVREIMQSAMHV